MHVHVGGERGAKLEHEQKLLPESLRVKIMHNCGLGELGSQKCLKRADRTHRDIETP